MSQHPQVKSLCVLLACQDETLYCYWYPFLGKLRFLRKSGFDESLSIAFKDRWTAYARAEGFTPFVLGGEA